jgi:ACR3 family arsenite transporter
VTTETQDTLEVPGREQAGQGDAVIRRLSTLDRFLPVWILAAMGAGLGLGAVFPRLEHALNSVQVTGTSLPIAVGLLLMMYPVLARVRYEQLGRLRAERGLFASSLALNWLIGPAVMFALAWLLLPDQPAYRTGLIIVGLARCIAMVLIWSELACADREATAVLVAINSVFQILAYSLLGYFYITLLPTWLGLGSQQIHIGLWPVARTVLIFLGIPLAAGYLTRRTGLKARGAEWYERRFLPRIGPIALYGLLFTIVLLFALQGHQITHHPLDVIGIALPLLAYFAIMFSLSFAWGIATGLGYERTATLAFTAASNNFELAIAVAIGVFGATSGQALAGVVGPLIEVPVLVALVYVSLWARKHLASLRPAPGAAARAAPDAHRG